MTEAVNADMLVVARVSRGISQVELANAAGVSQGLISKAENGLISPSQSEMEKIAHHLDYPVALFYDRDSLREFGSGCLYHRSRKTMPRRLLLELDAQMRMRNYNIRRLIHGLQLLPDRVFPTYDLDEFGGSAVQAAQALRRLWRIPSGPIPNLTELIESTGGIVFLTPFPTRKLFGMSCWMTRDYPFFYLNSGAPTAVLRWTMAHELGHLVLHGVASDGDQEEQADEFAGEFLTPRDEIFAELRRLEFGDLPMLKMFWRVSMKALINRARRLGAIDPMRAARLFKQYSARGYNDSEPYPLPAETPSLISSAIRFHLERHGYSVEELAQATRLSEREFLGELSENLPNSRRVMQVVRV